REVLRNVAHGLTTDDIAGRLAISERTVQFHLDAVRTKLGASNRQEAVALGIQRGLVNMFPGPSTAIHNAIGRSASVMTGPDSARVRHLDNSFREARSPTEPRPVGV